MNTPNPKKEAPFLFWRRQLYNTTSKRNFYFRGDERWIFKSSRGGMQERVGTSFFPCSFVSSLECNSTLRKTSVNFHKTQSLNKLTYPSSPSTNPTSLRNILRRRRRRDISISLAVTHLRRRRRRDAAKPARHTWRTHLPRLAVRVHHGRSGAVGRAGAAVEARRARHLLLLVLLLLG